MQNFCFNQKRKINNQTAQIQREREGEREREKGKRDVGGRVNDIRGKGREGRKREGVVEGENTRVRERERER